MLRRALLLLLPTCFVQSACTQTDAEFWLNNVTAWVSGGLVDGYSSGGPQTIPSRSDRSSSTEEPPPQTPTSEADPAEPERAGLPSTSSGAGTDPVTARAAAGPGQSGSILDRYQVTEGVTLPVEPDGSDRGAPEPRGTGSGRTAAEEPGQDAEMGGMTGPDYSPGMGEDT